MRMRGSASRKRARTLSSMVSSRWRATCSDCASSSRRLPPARSRPRLTIGRGSALGHGTLASDSIEGSAAITQASVTNQYQAGVVNYLNVITAQTSALNSERSMLDLMARRLVASLALVKALGGGWDGAAVAGPVGGSGKAVGSAYTPAPDS